MTEAFWSNDNSDSSIFQARIREEDLAEEQKIDKIIRAVDKFVREAASQTYAQTNQEVDSKFNDLLLEIDHYAEENSSSSAEGVLQAIYKCLKNFFNEFGIYLERPSLKLKLLEKEKDKNWLFSIIKVLCDKLGRLFSKVFKQDLNWDEALEKEIKELQKKLESGDLSKDEIAEASAKLEALRAMKLKFQMAFASFLLTNFFTLLEFELGVAQAQETSTEKNKKTESKTSEVRQSKESVEVKVNEENKKELQNIIQDPLLVIPERYTGIKNFKEKENEEKKLTIPVKSDLDLVNFVKNMNLELEKFIEPKQEVKEKPKPAPAKVPEVNLVQEIYKQHSSSEKEIMRSKSNNFDRKKAPIRPKQKIEDFYNKTSIGQGTVKGNDGIECKTQAKVPSELNEMKKIEHLSKTDYISCVRSM